MAKASKSASKGGAKGSAGRRQASAGKAASSKQAAGRGKGDASRVTGSEFDPNQTAPFSPGNNPSPQPGPAANQANPENMPPAPPSAEDPSRQNPAALAAAQQAGSARGPAPQGNVGFPGFPKVKYHPVYGAREIVTPNDEALLVPAHNWFDSAEAADAARTDREAQMVIHNNARVRVDAASGTADPNVEGHGVPVEEVRGEAGIVRNSVTATESLKRGNAEPL